MNYLLWANESSTTGRELLAELVNELGGSFPLEGGQHPPEKLETLIRWGSYASIARKAKRTLNYANFIQLASNKLESLKKFKAAGVPTPKFWTASEIDSVELPVLGRKTRHTQGTDIILCLQRDDLRKALEPARRHKDSRYPSDYFVEYVATRYEYRVHVYKDAVLRYSQKMLTEDEKYTNNWVRNFDNGYTFRLPENKLGGIAKGICIEAVACLGLHFGAVDLIIGDDGQPRVLEVNTAPGLRQENNLGAYTKVFAEFLKNPVQEAVNVGVV